MKKIEFYLDQFQLAKISPPIRTKSDIMLVWMQIAKLVSAYFPPHVDHVAAKLTLIIAKMNRVFIEFENKTYSINMPFSVSEADGQIVLKTRSGIAVDSFVSSEIISLIQTENILQQEEVWGWIESFENISDFKAEVWVAFRDLVAAEDAYLRYDHDPKNANKHLHPLYHLDVFYNGGATFKMGLENAIDTNKLADILDVTTDCHYVTQAT